ncbi:MAG: thiamine diphosphokinase [Bacilli bacterium]
MTRIAVCCAGPRDHLVDLGLFTTHVDRWIAVDGGLAYVIEAGITPDVALGDWDSLGYVPQFENDTTRFVYPSEKDDSDFELALGEALKLGVTQLFVFGATGGRLDHALTNLFVLGRFKQTNPNIEIHVHDRQNITSYLLPGHHTFMKSSSFQYFSFIALFQSIEGVTHEGFKYALQNGTIATGSSLGISNEIVADIGHFSFKEGICIVVRSQDGS